MAEPNNERASDKPKESPPAVIPPTENNPEDSIKEHEQKENPPSKDKEKYNAPEPPVTNKNKWKRSEIISLIGIILSSVAIFMTIKSFDKTRESVEISNKTFGHNRDKDILEEERQRIKDRKDATNQIRRDSIDSAERRFNRNYIDSTLAINREYAFAMSKQASASDSAVGIADKTLRENIKSAKFYQESVMDENRAFVVVPDMFINRIIADSFWKVSAIIKNIGKTPAYSLTGTLVCDTGISPSQWNTQATINYRKDTTFKFSLGADIPFNVNFNPAPLNANQIKRLQNQQTFIYAMIEVTYTDIFNRKHFTHSIMKYSFKDKAFKFEKGYNDAD